MRATYLSLPPLKQNFDPVKSMIATAALTTYLQALSARDDQVLPRV